MLSRFTDITRIIIVASAVLTLTAVSAGAQEITYDLTPTHELGAELWKIPISGKLTMSADGKRVLVACLADSAFYMVDVETGAYKKLNARYFQDNNNGNTFYRTDPDLSILAEKTTRSGVLRVWDLRADSLMASQNIGFGYLSAVSRIHDRVIQAQWVMRATTLEIVDTLAEPTDAWFDDARGKVYFLDDRRLVEADVSNNTVLRTWSVRAQSGAVLRPIESDWLYVFSTLTNGLPGGSQNLVEAIHLVTGERLTFEKYFWSGADGSPDFTNSYPYFYPTTSTCHARGADGGHRNVLWVFDAEARRSGVIVDMNVVYIDRPGLKPFVSDANHSLIIHGWNTNWRDSTILRCNALVPAASSTHENPNDESSRDVSVVQRDNTLTIELVRSDTEELITNVQIFTTDGIVATNMPVSDQSVPVTVSVDHLSSGAYRCVVTTTKRELFASFTIVR